MGFLEAGTPLPWANSLEFAAYVRTHGIQQFLHTFHRVKGRQNDTLKWGDEIEYHLVEFHPDKKSTTISLTAPEVVHRLEEEDKTHHFPILSAWRPEYGSWMVEATPGVPYCGDTSDLRQVELNMAMRRYRIVSACGPNVVPFSIVNYPLLGVGAFTSQRPSKNIPHSSPFSRSQYVPDACISPHPRFGTLTANIRHRRGRKVCIQMPLFPDTHTDMTTAVTLLDTTGKPCASKEEALKDAVYSIDEPEAVQFAESAVSNAVASGDFAADTDVGTACVAKAGHIHMDCMAFGMGCCCLQVTFQARDLAESTFLYDQLAVMSPLMMALTANAPIWRGRLADIDTRWDVIAASVDCRTPAECSGSTDAAPSWVGTEFAENSAGHGRRPINKSRYSSIDCYISSSPKLKDEYNDIPLAYDEAALAQLLEAGVDERLSRHIAHLFIRDPLVIFKERVYIDDEKSTEHFENIQSTNWRSVRWKPPPPDAADMGWRVELRTMEAQITDFENAAFTVFVVLLSRVILFFDLDLYIPMSQVDANFDRAARREAASKENFFFRANVTPLSRDCSAGDASAVLFQEMTLAEILMGHSPGGSSPAGSGSTPAEVFPGLVPLIFTYLDLIKCDEVTRRSIEHYIRFVVGRATGEIITGATWQRNFVLAHPAYRHDSVVSPDIVYDMMNAIGDIAFGRRRDTKLLGAAAPPTIVLDASSFSSTVECLEEALLDGSMSAASSTTGSESTTGSSPAARSRSTLSPTSPRISEVLRMDAAPGVRMRGRSFAEEVRERCAECMVIRSLLERYTVKEGVRFEDVPAFLDAREDGEEVPHAEKIARSLESSLPK